MPRVGWLLLVLATAAGGAVAAIPPRAAARGRPLRTRPRPGRRPVPHPPRPRHRRPAPGVAQGTRTGADRSAPANRVRVAGARGGARGRRGEARAKVVDATYAAELDGGDLTGTAEIGVTQRARRDRVRAARPVAPRGPRAKWSDGRPAILSVPANGTAPAVWVERDGRDVLRLNWSLAGTTEPGERRFELRVPPCPAATLELTLPDGQVPTAPADVLLTGPFEAPGQAEPPAVAAAVRRPLEGGVRGAAPRARPGGAVQAKLVAPVRPRARPAHRDVRVRPAPGPRVDGRVGVHRRRRLARHRRGDEQPRRLDRRSARARRHPARPRHAPPARPGRQGAAHRDRAVPRCRSPAGRAAARGPPARRGPRRREAGSPVRTRV